MTEIDSFQMKSIIFLKNSINQMDLFIVRQYKIDSKYCGASYANPL